MSAEVNGTPRPVSLAELTYLLSVPSMTVKRWVKDHGMPTESVPYSPVAHYRLSSIMKWLEDTGRISYAERLK